MNYFRPSLALPALAVVPVGSARAAATGPAANAPAWRTWLGVSLLMLAVATVELAAIAARSTGEGADAAPASGPDSEPEPDPEPPADATAPTDRESAAATPTVDAVSPDGGDDEAPPDSPSPRLDGAREQASAGNAEAAIGTAYAAVHERLSRSPEATGRSLTHWELYRERRDALADERADDLRRLVELYERAAFGPDSSAPGTAAEAIAAAESVLAAGPAAPPSDAA